MDESIWKASLFWVRKLGNVHYIVEPWRSQSTLRIILGAQEDGSEAQESVLLL